MKRGLRSATASVRRCLRGTKPEGVVRMMRRRVAVDKGLPRVGTVDPPVAEHGDGTSET